jgi:Icc-related predicted phosphoesterase
VRIAYLVDVHDRFEAVERAMAAIGAVDLLIVGGDITTGGGPDDAARAIVRWRQLAPALLAVAGNMDSPAIDARLDELGVGIDGRGVSFGDVGVFGVSGCPPTSMNTPYELSEEELEERGERGAAAVRGCRVRIFCPHAPPSETACDRLRDGRHVGSVAVRRLIEREQPDLVLCGHIHEARGEDAIGRTRIVNPGPALAGHHATIEVGEGIAVRLDG